MTRGVLLLLLMSLGALGEPGVAPGFAGVLGQRTRFAADCAGTRVGGSLALPEATMGAEGHLRPIVEAPAYCATIHSISKAPAWGQLLPPCTAATELQAAPVPCSAAPVLQSHPPPPPHPHAGRPLSGSAVLQTTAERECCNRVLGLHSSASFNAARILAVPRLSASAADQLLAPPNPLLMRCPLPLLPASALQAASWLRTSTWCCPWTPLPAT